MENNKNRGGGRAGSVLVVLLFFVGVAVIAAGLWLLSHGVSLVFIGCAALYLAGCVSLAADTRRKDDAQ